MTEITTGIAVTVRFFAAARDAAGADTRTLTLPAGAAVADAISELCGHSGELALVLQKCSYLRDGIAVRDRTAVLQDGQTLDVLPPFAGG